MKEEKKEKREIIVEKKQLVEVNFKTMTSRQIANKTGTKAGTFKSKTELCKIVEKENKAKVIWQ
ncbi:MAG: hypothetical protein GY679_01315 [Mycoplasma sp.]|nr:hypothetical protein [Mycoplasma sp.]